jgi:RecJ-like exonuclease
VTGPGKEELIVALKKSVMELQQGIDIHSCLVASVLQDKMDDRPLRELQAACPGISREQRMKGAIQEAIDVLENSRKAFKSKQLEALRKKLTQVLIDTQ